VVAFFLCSEQGDQIGRISACWVTVGQLKITRVPSLQFSTAKVACKFRIKSVGLHGGRFFHQLIRSPWFGGNKNPNEIGEA
jgi:hypothetical protein